MESICSSETSADTQRTTRRYIPEDGTRNMPSFATGNIGTEPCEEREYED
jgi:hypothetical protein